jgi:predicted O-methyltransferase YrrM
VLRECVRFTRNLPGALAECGTYQGASAYFMAREAPGVPLYLFDSFEGLSAPDATDRRVAEDHLPWQAGDMRSTEETLRGTLAEFDNVHILKGWIPERFPEVANERFRLLHIDVDLYQPTLDTLKFYYPRMNPGGVIVMDDYGSTLCPGAHRAVTEFMGDKMERVIHLPTGQGIIIKT